MAAEEREPAEACLQEWATQLSPCMSWGLRSPLMAGVLPPQTRDLPLQAPPSTNRTLAAEERLPAEAYLREWGAQLFPPWMEDSIHPLMTAMLRADVDARLAHLQAQWPDLLRTLGGPTPR